jgi:hypothetical protein
MIWSVETDDFLGKCHDHKYHILNAIKTTQCGGTIVSTIKNKIRQQYLYNSCCTHSSTNQTSPTNEHDSSSSNASYLNLEGVCFNLAGTLDICT